MSRSKESRTFHQICTNMSSAIFFFCIIVLYPLFFLSSYAPLSCLETSLKINVRTTTRYWTDDSKILYVLGHDSRRAMTPRKSLLLRLSSLTFPTYDFVVCAHMSLIHLTYFFKVTFTCAYSLGSM